MKKLILTIVPVMIVVLAIFSSVAAAAPTASGNISFSNNIFGTGTAKSSATISKCSQTYYFTWNTAIEIWKDSYTRWDVVDVDSGRGYTSTVFSKGGSSSVSHKDSSKGYGSWLVGITTTAGNLYTGSTGWS